MPTQYLTDKTGEKVSVVIPVKDYGGMLEELDQLNCIQAYDKSKSGKPRFVTSEIAIKEIERKKN